MKKVQIAAALTFTAVLLGGCGSKFDAAAYTKALLDNSYKNDSTQFVAMEIGTAEEAAQLYEEGLDSEVDAMLASAGSSITDEQAESFRQIFADILAGASYTVGEAVKGDDGSYEVTITYEQMQVFAPAIEAYMTDINNMVEDWTNAASAGEEIPSEDEMTAAIIDSLKTSFEEALPNATYAEPATATITIELIDNVYTPSESDLADLERNLFDVDAATEMMQQ